MKFKILPIAGDASFRTFYRIILNKKSKIIVLAKKEKYKNLIAYTAINKFLRGNKIIAPELYKHNFSKGLIVIQDFGDSGWIDDIGNMINTEGYYLKVNAPTQLMTTGDPITTPFEIPLYTGWNIMGFPLSNPQSAMDILQLLIDDGTLLNMKEFLVLTSLISLKNLIFSFSEDAILCATKLVFFKNLAESISKAEHKKSIFISSQYFFKFGIQLLFSLNFLRVDIFLVPLR